MTALDRTPEPSEIIVVVNGAPMEDYVHLAAEYPCVRWEHSEEPLGFTGAISRGITARNNRDRTMWILESAGDVFSGTYSSRMTSS